MKPAQFLLYTSACLLILFSTSSQAIERAIGFYYGLGAGAIVPGATQQTNDNDPAISGELVLGIEENGWSIEAAGFSSLEAGTDTTSIDYSVQGYNLSLGYRTIKRNGSYYLFKIARTEMDFDFSSVFSAAGTSGTSYSIGIGRQMDLDENLEAIYSYYDSDDLPDPVHMLSIRYLWEGLSSEKNTVNTGPFYMGAMLGLLDPDLGSDFDTANAYGLLLGYDLSKSLAPGISIELLVGTSAEADSFLSEPAFPDTYTTSYFALYGVYRSPGSIYFKTRAGYLNATIEDDIYLDAGGGTFVFDGTDKASEGGLSYSLGFGFKTGSRVRLELEYTRTALDESGFKFDPTITSLSFLYSF